MNCKPFFSNTLLKMARSKKPKGVVYRNIRRPCHKWVACRSWTTGQLKLFTNVARNVVELCYNVIILRNVNLNKGMSQDRSCYYKHLILSTFTLLSKTAETFSHHSTYYIRFGGGIRLVFQSIQYIYRGVQALFGHPVYF